MFLYISMTLPKMFIYSLIVLILSFLIPFVIYKLITIGANKNNVKYSDLDFENKKECEDD